MNTRDAIYEALNNPAPSIDTQNELLEGAGGLWAHLLSAPADDITDLQVVTAVLTLTSTDVCDEFIATMCPGLYSADTNYFGHVEPVTTNSDDGTLNRLVWVTRKVDWPSLPGAGNLWVCLGFACSVNGDDEAAFECSQAAQTYGANENMIATLRAVSDPHGDRGDRQEAPDLQGDFDIDDELQNVLDGPDPRRETATEETEFQTSWWEQRLSETPDQVDSTRPLPTSQAPSVFIDPDTTEEIPAVKPVIDRDNRPGRSHGHRWGRNGSAGAPNWWGK